MRQLGDIVKSLAAQPQQPLHASHLAAAQVEEQASRSSTHPSAKAPNRGYLARELVQCTLPHSDPKKDVYIRTDGKYRLMIESGTNIQTGEKIGLPYGTLPRLLMLFVNTEAVRKQGDEDELVISFGNTMNEFLRNVGCNPSTGGGKRGDAARIRIQHERLFAARFTFAQSEGDAIFGSETRRPIEITTEIRTFWDYRNPDQGSFWESYVKLTKEFQQALIANPVPFDFEHLKALKRSALALDLYCWLTYRIYRADGEGFNIPYQALHQQFGTGYKRERDFRLAMSEELRLVAEVFTGLRYDFTPRGLTIESMSRRDLPVPSAAKPITSLLGPGGVPLPARGYSHAAPQSERPYNSMCLAIMPADMWKVNRLAEKHGFKLDEIMAKWRDWCVERRVVPKNAAAHLSNFIKNHDPERGY